LILFLDTSALVKLYIAEIGSERMLEAAQVGDPIAVSMLAASALLLHQQGLEVTFACCDQRLLAAATSEGLATFDPRQGP
jgi:predicted nucleic acid-binding protein